MLCTNLVISPMRVRCAQLTMKHATVLHHYSTFSPYQSQKLQIGIGQSFIQEGQFTQYWLYGWYYNIMLNIGLIFVLKYYSLKRHCKLTSIHFENYFIVLIITGMMPKKDCFAVNTFINSFIFSIKCFAVDAYSQHDLSLRDIFKYSFSALNLSIESCFYCSQYLVQLPMVISTVDVWCTYSYEIMCFCMYLEL